MSSYSSPRRISHRSRLYQVLVLLCMLVFTWQLLLTHHHDKAERVHDCVSCHAAATLHGGVPPAPVSVAPIVLALVQYVLPQPAAAGVVTVAAYLTPPQQAPPASALSR